MYLFRLFGQAAKWLDKKDKVNLKCYITAWLTNNCNTYIVQYLENIKAIRQ